MERSGVVDAQVGDAVVSGRFQEVLAFLVTGGTRPFWVAERPYRELSNREDQAGHVAGFLKSEKAVRGLPKP